MITKTSESPRAPLSKGRKALAIFIGVALTIVIVSPISLSSQDLVRWATDPHGLGMSQSLGWIVFVALDMAAATCVGMVTFSAWRGENAGTFHALTWLFAVGSAYANYRHGIALRDSGKAHDAWWFFPAMSLSGPLLLDVVLARVKRWTRQAERTQMSARPRFGVRWIPGVAFRETCKAWAASRREDIHKPADAIAYVRECEALAGMAPVDRVRYAWSALGSYDEYSARKWLAAHRITVDQSTMDDAIAGRPRSPLSDRTYDTGPIPVIGSTIREIEAPATETPSEPAPVNVDHAEDIAALAALRSKRDRIRHAFAVIGSYDVSLAVAWLADRGYSVDRSDAYSVRKSEQEKSRKSGLHVVSENRGSSTL